MELVPLFFLVPPSRRLHLWSVHHHHLCQRWPGGDRKPDAPLPVSLPSKLHGVGLQVPSAVHHRAPGLHRQPPGGHVCTEIFPFEGLSAQCVLCRVHCGRSKYHKYFYTLYAPEINWRKIPSHFVEKRLFFLEVSSDPGPQTTDHSVCYSEVRPEFFDRKYCLFFPLFLISSWRHLLLVLIIVTAVFVRGAKMFWMKIIFSLFFLLLFEKI